MATGNAVSKRDAALAQLDTAIRLFFLDGDPISVHTLAGAASEVFEQLCRSDDIDPFFTHIQETFHEDSATELRRLINQSRNFFKHADRDAAALLLGFDDEANEYMIYMAVEDCGRLLTAMPVSAQVYQAWFCACYPEKLATHITTTFEDLFPGIRELDRSRKKGLGLRVLGKYLADQSLLADPRTLSIPRLT